MWNVKITWSAINKKQIEKLHKLTKMWYIIKTKKLFLNHWNKNISHLIRESISIFSSILVRTQFNNNDRKKKKVPQSLFECVHLIFRQLKTTRVQSQVGILRNEYCIDAKCFHRGRPWPKGDFVQLTKCQVLSKIWCFRPTTD